MVLSCFSFQWDKWSLRDFKSSRACVAEFCAASNFPDCFRNNLTVGFQLKAKPSKNQKPSFQQWSCKLGGLLWWEWFCTKARSYFVALLVYFQATKEIHSALTENGRKSLAIIYFFLFSLISAVSVHPQSRRRMFCRRRFVVFVSVRSSLDLHEAQTRTVAMSTREEKRGEVH